MKFLFSSILLLLTWGGVDAKCTSPQDSVGGAYHPTDAMGPKMVRQRVNPIFGNEKEANQIISFIASNLVLEFSEEQIKKLDGYVVLNFVVDTAGTIGNLQVKKSYNIWVDYAILGAIKNLPPWGVPSMRQGEPVERTHQVVFSFGTYSNQGQTTYGLQNETIAQNTQDAIDEQRAEYAAKLKEEHNKWQSFTDVNSKLEYDIQDGLRQEAQTLQDGSALDNQGDFTPNTPTISITELN